MTLNLSGKQLTVLRRLRRFAAEHGYMPSIRELAREMGRSYATVRQYLDTLKARGWLVSDGTAHGLRFCQGRDRQLADLDGPGGTTSRTPGVPRSERGAGAPTQRPPDRSAPRVRSPEDALPSGAVRVPMIGSIAAGQPLEAIEVEGGEVVVPAAMAPPGAYALRVRGTSMVEDHILDGDLIVLRPQASVEGGEVAVVLLEDGTATLKRVYWEGGQVRLQPANSELKPMFVRKVRIQGRVTGLVRMIR
ncbi:MAG: repressor LexA [Candidatus Riflebacteria bacterium]|nr:repressor LexA [Candidatus Riflebacteria bacterium]